MTYLWIAVGGALGSVLRFWLSVSILGRTSAEFPWGTIVVNVTGCFIIGLFDALIRPDQGLLGQPHIRQFVTIGLLGGYTTFSSFSLQTLALARGGEWLSAGTNVMISVAACLVAVWLGHLAGTAMNR